MDRTEPSPPPAPGVPGEGASRASPSRLRAGAPHYPSKLPRITPDQTNPPNARRPAGPSASGCDAWATPGVVGGLAVCAGRSQRRERLPLRLVVVPDQVEEAVLVEDRDAVLARPRADVRVGLGLGDGGVVLGLEDRVAGELVAVGAGDLRLIAEHDEGRVQVERDGQVRAPLRHQPPAHSRLL